MYSVGIVLVTRPDGAVECKGRVTNWSDSIIMRWNRLTFSKEVDDHLPETQEVANCEPNASTKARLASAVELVDAMTTQVTPAAAN
jgi:hypothetical protein